MERRGNTTSARIAGQHTAHASIQLMNWVYMETKKDTEFKDISKEEEKAVKTLLKLFAKEQSYELTFNSGKLPNAFKLILKLNYEDYNMETKESRITDAYEEYYTIRHSAQKEYDKIQKPLWNNYYICQKPYWDKYQKIVNVAEKKLQKKLKEIEESDENGN